MHEITVYLFGSLKEEFGESKKIILRESPCSAFQIKTALYDKFREQQENLTKEEYILKSCVIACDDSILHNHDEVDINGEISLLPPVSGG